MMLQSRLEGNAVVVSRYDVPESNQKTLSKLLQKHLRDWICRRPGFVAGSILQSIDDGHVVVCTTWQQASDGVNFMDCDEGRGLFADLTGSGAKERQSYTYRCGDVVERSSGGPSI